MSTLSMDHARIADGHYDDPPMLTLADDVLDTMPFQRIEAAAPCRKMTARQRARIERNCVIKAAYDRGISQRVLARVFDLPRSVVAQVIQGRQLCGRSRANRDDHT